MNMGAKIDKNEQINKFLCSFFAVWTENKRWDVLTDFPSPVIRLGLEPKTYCLEGSCSIQLSYQTKNLVF